MSLKLIRNVNKGIDRCREVFEAESLANCVGTPYKQIQCYSHCLSMPLGLPPPKRLSKNYFLSLKNASMLTAMFKAMVFLILMKY